MGAPDRRLPWHPYWRAERAIRRLGQLRPVGLAAIVGQLALEDSPAGPVIGAIETNNAEGTTAGLARLSEAVKDGERAFLVVGHSMQSFSGQLTTRDIIGVLTSVEQRFRILSVISLVNPTEAKAATRHRRLAMEIRRATPLQALKWVLVSVLSVSAVVLSNLFGRGNEQPVEHSAVLLLELRRN